MKAVALSLMTTMAITLSVASPANAEIAWHSNLRTAHAQAQSEGKLLLLHFYTDDCSWCDKLEAGAFKDPSVDRAISQNFVPVKVHAGQTPKLAEMFKVTKFPTDVIVNVEGKTLSHGVSPQEPIGYVAMLTGSLPKSTASTSTMIAATSAPAQPAPANNAGSPPSYAAPTANQVAAAPATQVAQTTQAAPAKPSSFALPSATTTAAGATQNTKLVSNRSDDMSLAMPDELMAPSQTFAPEKTAAKVAAAVMTAPKSSKAKPANVPSDPQLSMEGYCSVTVVDDAQWVEGSPEFGVIHLGKLYLFATKEKMQKFLDNPIPYTPILNEIDVVRFFEERVIVPGKREWAMQDQVTKRMFFFADEAAMLHFEETHERYVDAAITVMETAVKESNPGT